MGRPADDWGSVNWKDSRPRHAPDSHPFMTLDWGNSAVTSNRRLHIRGFYRYHGVDDQYERLLKASELGICQSLYSRKVTGIPEPAFEYYVDVKVWKLIFHDFEASEQPKWPFRGDRDHSHGCRPSQVYNDFRAKQVEAEQIQASELASSNKKAALPTSVEAEASLVVDKHTEEDNTVSGTRQSPLSTSAEEKAVGSHGDQVPASTNRKRVATDDATDAAWERRKKRIFGDRSPIQKPLKNEAQPERCANCGDVSHKLGVCPQHTRIGILYGCPICNSMEHNINDCLKWPGLPLRDRYRVLVLNRGNMPPLATHDSRLWYNVLVDHLRASPQNSPPTTFPWTPAFGRQMAKYGGYKDGHTYPVNRWLLPTDPETKDWQTVQRHFGNGSRVTRVDLSTGLGLFGR
ncbi:hypothetical protein PCL_10002 [Purpureocillium lilacinum]|uniref:CCHC-type domain-containing protein n=1 Tax=Purpureocillium lilacinum TaxID=33203 RepID=A0A2U3EEP3_PURLI|nr:hypothetical protein PCL_10002 [Purpureocillium lilacinum]